MSEERRRARIERFRNNLVGRARSMTARLLQRIQGVGAAGDEQDVARELHTLKGDARMLGLTEISEVAHVAESLLIVNGTVRVDGERIVRALDEVIAALEGRLGDEAATSQALRAQAEALRVPSATPAPAGAEAAQAEAEAAPSPATRWVSVEAEPLDQVVDGLSEFAFDLRSLHHLARAQSRVANGENRRAALVRLEALDRLTARLDELVDGSWRLRLQPLEPILQDLARHARELAEQQGKRVRTSVRCASVQLERTVCDRLWDPLLHLVRNAVDHGMERPDERGDKQGEALLVLSAEPIGPNVVIEVYDDGRGVDTTRVRSTAVGRGLISVEQAFTLDERSALDLIFIHGFSTRAQADELSGRGIGLDVVRHEVERLGGSARVVSDLGQGTRFLLEVPARIGKERALVVQCAGTLYAIPSRSVREIVRLPVRLEPRLEHGLDQLPFMPLDAAVGAERTSCRFGLIVEVQNRRWAFGVSTLVGEHELVRRPVDELLGGSGLIGAAATLADGRLVLILSPSELARRTAEEGVLPTPVPLPTEEPDSRGDA